MNENLKCALENIHKKEYKSSETIKKLKDWWVQGLQLNKCYLEHWDEIKEIFKRNRMDLNIYSPILTMNELKYIRLADEISTNSDDFILILHCLPIYCRKIASDTFLKWFEQNKPIIKSLKGTIMDIDKELEDLIK